MIGCIDNKHAYQPVVIFKLAADLFSIMNDTNFSKCSERINKQRVLPVKLAKERFLLTLCRCILHLGCGVSTFGLQAFAQVFACTDQPGQV